MGFMIQNVQNLLDSLLALSAVSDAFIRLAL